MNKIDSLRDRLEAVRDERHFPADMLAAHDEMTDLLEEIAALSATPAPAVDAQEEAEHIRRTEMQEIADGAYGDGPATRGAARDYLSAPAVDAVPAGEVERLRALYETHLAAPFDKSPRNGAPSEEWELWYAANRARKELLDAVPALLASLSHGEGRK